jgi:hypothetical protein
MLRLEIGGRMLITDSLISKQANSNLFQNIFILLVRRDLTEVWNYRAHLLLKLGDHNLHLVNAVR